MPCSALVGTLVVVPDSTDEQPPALDVVGAIFSLVGVSGLVAGIIEGPERGWSDAITLGALAAGAVGLVAFVLWELRAEEPLLDVRLFRVRGFSAGSIAIAAQFFASFGLFFTILQYLQFVVGYSPLRATLCLLPLPLFVLPLARTAPRIAQRVGFRRVTPLGLTLSAVGLVIVATVGTELVYWRLALGLALFGAGMGLAGTPATTEITSSLPPSKQGVASAVNDVSREVGSALGIAILGSALNQTYRDGVASVVAGLPAAGRRVRHPLDRLHPEPGDRPVRRNGPPGRRGGPVRLRRRHLHRAAHGGCRRRGRRGRHLVRLATARLRTACRPVARARRGSGARLRGPSEGSVGQGPGRHRDARRRSSG